MSKVAKRKLCFLLFAAWMMVFAFPVESNAIPNMRVNIALDANGGSCEMDTTWTLQNQAYGLKYSLPIPTKTGYTFTGWSYNGVLVTNETIILVNSAHTLVANYTPNNYTVSFNANGGSCSTASKTVTYDGLYGSLPIPTKAGHTFTSWTYNGQVVTDTTFCNVAGNHTLTANYTVNNYTVKFNANGGSCSQTSKKVTYGGKYGDLPTPTKNGYTFTGWTYNGTKITSNTALNTMADHTLVANYTPNTYTVTFIVKGEEYSKKTVTYDGVYGVLPNLSVEQYVFTGWTYNGTTVTSSTIANLTASNHSLVARLTPNQYTLTFNGNGGVCSEDKKLITYDAKIGELPTPTYEGFIFKGWYVGDIQVTKDTVSKFTSEQTAVAKWEGIPVLFSFDAADGKCDVSEISWPYKSVFTELPTPVKDGYEFDGWYTEKNGKGTLVKNGEPNNFLSSTKLYANWICKTYSIKYDSEGGNKCDSTKVSYNSKVGELPKPKRTGYTFAGWYTKSGNQLEEGMVWRNLSDITVYAKWTANQYTVKFNPAGGKVSKKSMSVAYDSKWTNIPTPTKKGKVFAGWYTKKNGKGSKLVYNNKFTSTKKVTYYAYWVSKEMKGIVYDGTYKVDSKKKGSFDVTFKKNKSAAGYEIQYSTDKKFNKKKTKTIKTSSNSITVELVKPKQTYYVRIRAYAKKGSKTVYGKWSSAKKFVAKK